MPRYFVVEFLFVLFSTSSIQLNPPFSISPIVDNFRVLLFFLKADKAVSGRSMFDAIHFRWFAPISADRQVTTYYRVDSRAGH